MTDYSNELPKLIGATADDPDVLAFLQGLDSGARTKSDSGKYYWISNPAGMEIHAEDRTKQIHTVMLYAEGVHKFTQYGGALPEKLAFGMQRDVVKQQLGEPDMAGPSHDKWEREGHGLIVRYDKSGAVTRVGITGY